MQGDLRHACRSLLRMPAVSAVVVISLALGIGVNTVVFSWIQARVLRPIPGAPDGGRIQLIEARTATGLYNGSSWLEYKDLREGLRSFEDVFAARMVPLYLGEPGSVERVFGLVVSDNYFKALRLQPALGRFLTPAEVSQEGREPVAVISHRLWQKQFAGSIGALSQTVRINGQALTVVGVTPPEFQGTVVGLQFDAWLPATLAPVLANGSSELEERSFRGYSVMGRLRREATAAQAQLEVNALMERLAHDFAATNTKVTAEVVPFSDSPRGPQRMFNSALFVLQAIMVLLLFAVCGNVANLLLARASARQKEMAIRLTLGAKPWRVGRLLIAENILLALLGAVVGAGLAVWGTKALMLLPRVTGLPLRFETSVDAQGLAFAIGLGLVSSVLFGLPPVLHLCRVEPQLGNRASTRSGGRSFMRQGLMAVQVGLATMVLIVAGMFFRSFMETRTTDPGFRRDGVLLATYDLAGRSVESGFSRPLAARTLERLASLPSVEAVAIASSVPLDIHGMPSRVITVEGHPPSVSGDDEALANVVTPGYFEVMGIELIAGRDFSPILDAGTSKEAIVNEEFLKRYVQKGEALGREIRARGGPFAIVGVARDSLYNAFGERPTPAIYFSYRDLPSPRGEIHVLSRRSGNGVGAEIRATMRELDPELPVFNVRTMTEQVDANLIFRRIPAQMFSVLGPLLLVLAAIGIYAVVSYAVSLRTLEIGVRLALGASSQRVVRHFVEENFKVATFGALIGWTLALGLAWRWAPASSLDPGVFLLAPLVLLTVAGLSCWIPARRAARVEAAFALRGE